MRPTRSLFHLILTACFTLLAVPFAWAQIPPRSDTTSTPIPGAGHDYIGAPVETVNPANGAVSIRIPAIIPPGRGITLPFSFAYDSNGVAYLGTTTSGQFSWITAQSLVSKSGWSNTAPVLSVSQLAYTVPNGTGDGYQTCGLLYNYVLQDAHGNR